MDRTISDIDGLQIDFSAIANVPESLKGEDGFSPAVTITSISGGHAVTITDKAHPIDGQTFNVLDGKDGSADVEQVKLLLQEHMAIDTINDAGVNYIRLLFDTTEISRTPAVSSDVRCTSVEFTVTSKTVRGTLPMSAGINVAAVLPVNCTQDTVYVSGDESIATVDNFGQVTAMANGTTNIICSCGNKFAYYELVVKDFAVCEQVAIEEKIFLFDYDQQTTFQLNAIVEPVEYTGTPVWSIESLVPNSSTGEYLQAATIDQNGLIKYTNPSKIRATVTCGDKSASQVIQCFQKLSLCQHSFDNGYISEDGYKLRASAAHITPTHPEEGCLFKMAIDDIYEIVISEPDVFMFNIMVLQGNAKTAYPMYAYACPNATMFTVGKQLSSLTWSTKDIEATGTGTVTIGSNKMNVITYGAQTITSTTPAVYTDCVFVSFNIAFRNQKDSSTYHGETRTLKSLIADGTIWNGLKISRNGVKILGGLE